MKDFNAAIATIVKSNTPNRNEFQLTPSIQKKCMPAYYLFFDGAFKNKIASFGFVLYLDGKEIDRGWGVIGQGSYMTEIIAEYYGLSAGLDSFVRHLDRPCSVLNICGDSAHVIGQIKKIRKPRQQLQELQVIEFKLNQIKRLVSQVNISWISRAQNKIANDLAKKLRL